MSHSISLTNLIQYNVRALRQNQISVLQDVHQTAGGRYDDLAPSSELEALVLSGDAPDDGDATDTQGCTKLDRLLFDLLG